MASVEIEVHPLTQNPTEAWQKISVKQPKGHDPQVLPLDEPIYENKVRFVCMSDTHSQTAKLPTNFIPDGDVFLHAGDFTKVGRPGEVVDFNAFLKTLPHKHKIVIAGNHDLTFDPTFLDPGQKREDLERCFRVKPNSVDEFLKKRNITSMKQVLKDGVYLEDSETSVHGVRIYGSPWQPEFCDWGFNLDRGQPCLDKWNKIPEGIDVLMTHGPPIGYGDLCVSDQRAGCVELLTSIQKRIKPKFHIFGHIHEGYGAWSDGTTSYINASTCNLRYLPVNPPIIFDVDLPEGYTKYEL
ncbi:hypothetical protein CAPTEDRAFT_3300 [Capitella teleta]|uniref:Calcineurin-like phosphoesterase domain-containing protein n=1 Tax=Capitella teleta TaxID=283909 RepID=R7TWC5_CAPTE|nr:hypothetical protein CAPTEDRAFT_3300 [Capitella teleta]|eukprot:ELT98044.1 hypothetical protein CAPTEDRAFT_3300 [Capitella teleta]